VPVNRQFLIPDSLGRTTTEVNGRAGAEWFSRLPSILADCERRWSLTISPPFPRLSYNYAAPATREDGSTVVVKAGFPSRELLTEAEALRVYDGRGAVRLLDADLEQGVLLLEHLIPGTMLLAVEDDQEATSIAASVMKQLWRPVPEEHSFPSVGDWARGFTRLRAHFGGTSSPFSESLVARADELFAELHASMAEPVVLHGDFLHFNILRAQREPWLAIDPKGVVGEPAYETGAWMRNPMPKLLNEPHPGRVLARRIDQLAEELGLDRARIHGWSLAQAVLSAWWTFEDHGTVEDTALAVAELLSAIKP
jgi:streptomycin 6-kinase